MPRQHPSSFTPLTTPNKTPLADEGKPPSLSSKSLSGSARKKTEKPKLALSAKKSLDPLHATVRAAFAAAATDDATTQGGSKSESQIRQWIEANYRVDSGLLGELLPKSLRTLMKKQILAAMDEEDGVHPSPSEVHYYVINKSPPGHDDEERGGGEAGPSASRPSLTLKLARLTTPAARSKSLHETAGGNGWAGQSTREGRSMKKRKSEMVAPPKPSPIAGQRSELRGLKDSLSAFFTPTDPRIRRSRLEAQTAISISTLQPLQSDGSALSVIVDEEHQQPKAIRAKHGPISSSTVESMATSGDTSHSPHRHKAKASAADQLQDALSTYFSASTERRRKHEAGEYLQLSQHGLTPLPVRGKRGEGDDSIAGSLDKLEPTSSSNHNHKADSDLQSTHDNSELGEQAMSSPPRLKRQTTRTPRAAQKATVAQQVPPDLPIRQRKATSVAALKSASLVRRARQQQGAVAASRGRRKGRSVGGGAASSSALISNYFQPVKGAGDKKGRAAANTSPAPHLSPQKAPPLSPPQSLNYKSTPWDIPDEEETMFNKAREIVQQELYVNSKKMMKSKATTSGSNEAAQQPIYPPRIQIGQYRIDTWYSAPYPQEYASLPLLHVCEDCLMYLAVPESHAQKCRVLNPPGNEIYRQGNLSVWEVDGNLARVYCRNLCLLAKLFIDHKTLYFDVEPFLFYVLTQNDERGYHFVGYFSKEKYSQQKFMLACIVTLPCYHRHGYGRFLIDFSYLLARREGAIGTPERPLSDLGKIAYASYWRTALYEELYQRCVEDKAKALSLADLSEATGIAVHDVVEALTENNLLVATPENTVSLRINEKELERHWTKAHANPRRIWLDESKLHWEPKLYTPTKEHLGGLRSPTFSPVPHHRRVQAEPPPIVASTPPPATKVGKKKRGQKTGGGKKATATPRRKLSLDEEADLPSTSQQAATASIPPPTELKRKRGRPPKAKPEQESLAEESPKPEEGPKRRSQKSPTKPASTTSGCKPPEKKVRKPPETSDDDEDDTRGDRPSRTRGRRAASRGPIRGSDATEKPAQSKSGRALRDSGKCTVMRSNRPSSKQMRSDSIPIDPAQLSVAVNSLNDSSSQRVKSKTTFLSSSSSSSSASSDEEPSFPDIAPLNLDAESLKEMERVRDLESGSASDSEESSLFRPRTRSQHRRIDSIQSAEVKAALLRSSVSSDDVTSEVAKKTPKHKSTPKTPKPASTMAATERKTPQSATATGKRRLQRRRGLRPRPIASLSLSSSTHSRSNSKDPSASDRGAESDDEADEGGTGGDSDLVDSSYCCSSVSPPPRERGALRRARFTSTSTGAPNANESMINMGGEPNTVNMGGEPPPTPKSGAINTRQRPLSLEDYNSPKAPQGLLTISQPSRLAAGGEDKDEEGVTAPLLVANRSNEWVEGEGNDDGENVAMPELGSPNRLTVEDVFGEEGEEEDRCDGSEAEAKEEDDTPPQLSPNPIEHHPPAAVSEPESPPLQNLNELGLDGGKEVKGGAKTSKRRERTKHRKTPAMALAESKEKKTQPREPKTPRRRKSLEERKSAPKTMRSEKATVSSAALNQPLQGAGEYCLSLLDSEEASRSATSTATTHHQPLQRQESAPFISPPLQLSSIVGGNEPPMYEGEQAHPPVMAQMAPAPNVAALQMPQPSSQAVVNAVMPPVEQSMGPGQSQVAVPSLFHHQHTPAAVKEHHYQLHQGQLLDDLAGLSVPSQPQPQQVILAGPGPPMPPPNAYPQLGPLYHHTSPPPPPQLHPSLLPVLQQGSLEAQGSIIKPIPHFPMMDSTPSSTASYSSLNHHGRPSPTKPGKTKSGSGGKKGHKPKPSKGPISSLAVPGSMAPTIPPGMDPLAAAAYYQQYQAALVAHQAQSMMNGQYAPGVAAGGGAGYGHYGMSGGDMSSAMANYGNSINMYGLGSQPQQQHQHQSSQHQSYSGAYIWPAYYGFAAGQQCYSQGAFGQAQWPGGTPTVGMEQQAAMAAAAAAAGGGASAFPTPTASGHQAYSHTPTSTTPAVYQGVYGAAANPYLTNS